MSMKICKQNLRSDHFQDHYNQHVYRYFRITIQTYVRKYYLHMIDGLSIEKKNKIENNQNETFFGHGNLK